MYPSKLLRRIFVSVLGCGLLTVGLAASAQAQCQLNSPSGKIKHVVYVEFDNVHFTRDNPNVPSDLEQMPSLLNFLRQNGTLDTGDHTVLISHTANGILSSQTGLYSDNTGIFIANSFGDFARLFLKMRGSSLGCGVVHCSLANSFLACTKVGISGSAPFQRFLAKINPANGEETVIGPTGLGFNAFSLGEVGGKLYLTDFSNNLYSVDPETGAATLLAATGVPPDPNIPFTLNEDGTFNLCDEGLYSRDGKLYATFDSFAIDTTQNPPAIAHVFVSPALYQINPRTGAATLVAETELNLSALVEVDGKFYAFRAVLDGFDTTLNFPIGHTELLRLDLENGKTNKPTDVDHSLGPIFGAAPVRLSRWIASE